ncbi:MAG TPA: DNA-3-methyladenine glycosylase [Nitrosopumilaceae archaeon]|nr:DNA-3-methyladenine glycosylase [Nitrosopumilaceae archaeon]
MNEKKAITYLKKDPKLKKIIIKVGDYNIKITKNRYQSLVESIISQQLSGAAADAIIKKFKKLYPPKFPNPSDVINTSNSKLRNTGLSKMKILYIKDLSKKIELKELNFKKLIYQSDEKIIEVLTNVKGIGRWTAEMFLIFSIGRLDVLPVGDLGLKKAVKNLYSLETLPDEEKIIEIAKSWKPYRTIATWYLWKSLQKFDSIG